MSSSMRLHLLKTLERSRGVAFVRSCLQQHPLEDSDWLQEWIAENESGLLRFRGQNKLPHHNPLATEPFFTEASRAVSAFLSSGSLNLSKRSFQNTPLTAHSSPLCALCSSTKSACSRFCRTHWLAKLSIVFVCSASGSHLARSSTAYAVQLSVNYCNSVQEG